MLRRVLASTLAFILIGLPGVALAKGRHSFGFSNSGGSSRGTFGFGQHSYSGFSHFGSGASHLFSGFSLFHSFGGFMTGYFIGRFFHPFGGYYGGYGYQPFSLVHTVIDIVVLIIVFSFLRRIWRNFFR